MPRKGPSPAAPPTSVNSPLPGPGEPEALQSKETPLINLAHDLVAISKSHEGKTDGMGYTVDHVQPGRGFCSTEHSHKEMANGQIVALTTFYPGPFDAAAGLPSDITEKYSVWVGWGHEGSESKLPPVELPSGAKWGCSSFDGPVNWYAEFEDGEKAEAYAASLPPLPEDDSIPPFAE